LIEGYFITAGQVAVAQWSNNSHQPKNGEIYRGHDDFRSLEGSSLLGTK
jgi:hypothetical protein